ncbi:PilN domain-containing protein [Thauera sinica]|uniref:PilN domain-containing protein n=1 Tax=Thauera sinica TaxID=2665146 RepID=A0ABW1AN78_9RHOO|nr:PilN domain-containing protein [Thauera sp. K11]ATE60494.1 hypothetical protein CCZ27_11540 [Thauera sp. K11]
MRGFRLPWPRPSQAPERIELDFVPIRRAPTRLGWALLAVGLLCAGIELERFMSARAELDERARIVAALRSQQPAPAPPAPPEPPLTAQEVQGARRVAARLDADWSTVFAALARVRGSDVAWVEVEMVEVQAAGAGAGDASGRTAAGGLRLSGEARSLDAVLAVLDRMRHEPVLAGIDLVSHEAAAQDGADFVRFVVAARSRGGA